MAIEITIPRLGWSMEEGAFAGWLKPAGSHVAAGEPLFAVESDKATMDVESLDAGVLYLPADAAKTGDTVRVGQRIGYLLAAGEAAPEASVARAGPAPVTPRARRVAAELGVDVAALTGSGRGGRIRERDVRAAAPLRVEPVRVEPVRAEPVRVEPVRRAIAARMTESRDRTVPVTLTRRVDASRLTALRNRWKLALQPGPAPSYNDIVAKVAAIALTRHPAMGVGLPGSIDIGIAVDTERGLLAPVIRGVAQAPLEEVARQSRERIDAARRRTIQPDDLRGGVFTITNLGSYGVEEFTPVINPPEIAILGLGAIQWEAVVARNGQIVARERMALSLTFDHLMVDGAPAARFLREIAELIEEPPPEVHCR